MEPMIVYQNEVKKQLKHLKPLPWLSQQEAEQLLSFGKQYNENKTDRPQNQWILYRKAKKQAIPDTSKNELATESRKIADMWKNESDEVLQFFEALAEIAKCAHKKAFPDFKYQPKLHKNDRLSRKKGKKNRSQERIQDNRTERTPVGFVWVPPTILKLPSLNQTRCRLPPINVALREVLTLPFNEIPPIKVPLDQMPSFDRTPPVISRQSPYERPYDLSGPASSFPFKYQ